MNRIIKFRAWDGVDRVMIEAITGMHIAVIFENPNRFDVMQFTGLLDKNGKEIYEGDIITSQSEKSNSYRNEKTLKETNLVIFHKGCFCMSKIEGGALYGVDDGFVPMTFIDNFYAEKWDEFYEVIGNIYENPELGAL